MSAVWPDWFHFTGYQSIDQAEVYQQLRHASWTADDQALNMVLKDYGKLPCSSCCSVNFFGPTVRKSLCGWLMNGYFFINLDPDKVQQIQAMLRTSHAAHQLHD